MGIYYQLIRAFFFGDKIVQIILENKIVGTTSLQLYMDHLS